MNFFNLFVSFILACLISTIIFYGQPSDAPPLLKLKLNPPVPADAEQPTCTSFDMVVSTKDCFRCAVKSSAMPALK